MPGHYRATRRFWVGSCREDDLVGRQLSWSDWRTLVGPESAISGQSHPVVLPAGNVRHGHGSIAALRSAAHP